MNPDTFEGRFSVRLMPLLRALEQRRARTEKRRGAENSRRRDRNVEDLDEKRWREVREAYNKAHDALLAAGHWVHGAWVLLRIEQDEKALRERRSKPPGS